MYMYMSVYTSILILIVTTDSSNVQGVVCPNEAEFCGYDILFHLTDGDVLK